MRKLLKFYFFAVLFLSSCYDDSVTQVDPHGELLNEFNSESGFDAIIISDTGVVNSAKNWQGHGDYPGIDDWFAVQITFGPIVLGGLPGQSAFYSILKTYELSGGQAPAYWKLLQVKPHPVFGYRHLLGCFQVNRTINAAVSKTLANPQFGEGGGWQLYILNYDSSLTKFSEITLDTTSFKNEDR